MGAHDLTGALEPEAQSASVIARLCPPEAQEDALLVREIGETVYRLTRELGQVGLLRAELEPAGTCQAHIY